MLQHVTLTQNNSEVFLVLTDQQLHSEVRDSSFFAVGEVPAVSVKHVTFVIKK